MTKTLKEIKNQMNKLVEAIQVDKNNPLYQTIMSIDFDELKDEMFSNYLDYFKYDKMTSGGREFMGYYGSQPAYQSFGPELEGLDYDKDMVGLYIIENIFGNNLSDQEKQYVKDVCGTIEFADKLNITDDEWNNIETEIVDYKMSDDENY